MTSEFISFLELLAYYSARDNYCIPERESGRIAMPELFDLISGSETGAIIASSLNIPNPVDKRTKDSFGNVQINKNFANETSDLFQKNAKDLYRDQ
jgi:patatin-like phospholipase/acyl hydrolase